MQPVDGTFWTPLIYDYLELNNVLLLTFADVDHFFRLHNFIVSPSYFFSLVLTGTWPRLRTLMKKSQATQNRGRKNNRQTSYVSCLRGLTDCTMAPSRTRGKVSTSSWSRETRWAASPWLLLFILFFVAWVHNPVQFSSCFDPLFWFILAVWTELRLPLEAEPSLLWHPRHERHAGGEEGPCRDW